jgi:NAD+ diphosphatase
LREEEGSPEDLEPFGLVDENPQLPIELLSLGGMGRMILHWEKRSRFCGYCGQPTAWLPGDWGRGCDSCKNHLFPAIHPCSIVLVTRPGEVLLTRKPNWAPNRYSLVAGFQEFGESLEETAIREIAEETGIVAHNARYVGSQCWPFPSQVMVGFVADYVGGEIQVDTDELADARWFPVADLPGLPPKRSIARYILDTFLKLSDL